MGKLETVAGLGLIVLALFQSSAFAESEYYTWIDENGVVNYSERNPQGYNARFITSESRFGFRAARATQPAEPSATETPDSERSEAPAADFDQQMEEERARIAAELAPEKKANCAIGKRNLAQLEAYARIKIKDDEGKQRFLTDEEKAGRVRQAKETIRDNC